MRQQYGASSLNGGRRLLGEGNGVRNRFLAAAWFGAVSQACFIRFARPWFCGRGIGGECVELAGRVIWSAASSRRFVISRSDAVASAVLLLLFCVWRRDVTAVGRNDNGGWFAVLVVAGRRVKAARARRTPNYSNDVAPAGLYGLHLPSPGTDENCNVLRD